MKIGNVPLKILKAAHKAGATARTKSHYGPESGRVPAEYTKHDRAGMAAATEVIIEWVNTKLNQSVR